jgi:chorismate-pyruvate lyase
MAKRTRATPRRTGSAAPHGILYPLDVMCEWAGIPLPKAKAITPYEMPLPYRSLLVHESDMSITLERHFGGRVGLRVLSTFLKNGWYYRRVLLVQEYSGRPVEMGAIRMNVGAFSKRVRGQILANDVPIGRILRDANIEFKSQAKIFLEVKPNSEMMGVFWLREPRTLYGRQTEMIYRAKHIGDIVEVLPPV